MKITVNRREMSMPEIEEAIEKALIQELGAKKATVTCKTKNWQGHHCPEFVAVVDNVKFLLFGDVDEFDLEVNPWEYDMEIDYTFA